MCLLSEYMTPKVAQTDILCYKVINEVGNEYKTPFRKYPIYSLPCTLKGTGDKKVLPASNEYRSGCFWVGGGYVHSFSELGFAVEAMEEKGVVCSAIIPKGSLYFEGFVYDYASEELHIENIISRYDDYTKDNAPLCIDGDKVYTVGEIRDFLEKCKIAETKDHTKFVVRPDKERIPYESGARRPLTSYGKINLYRNKRFKVSDYWFINFVDIRNLLKKDEGTAMLSHI